MKLSKEEYDLLYKKLEYKFKNSGNDLVDKIKNHEDLSVDDITLLLKKLEYTFRKSENGIIKKLASMAGLEDYAPIKYGNIKAKKQRDLRELKEQHVIDFDNFIKNNV